MGWWSDVGPCFSRGRLVLAYPLHHVVGVHISPSRLTAQLVGPKTKESFNDGPRLQDMDLVVGPGRSSFASFTWADLDAVAPWMNAELTKRIDGPGLGN